MLLRTKQQGAVIILVLIFVCLFFMLTFTTLEATIINVKIENHIQQQNQIFQFAENILRQVEQTVVQQKCILPNIVLGYDYANLDDNWWLASFTCHYQSGSLVTAYFIEKLVQLPCYQWHGNKTVDVLFYRINVKIMDQADNQATVLQSVIAVPIAKQSICRGPLKRFKPGRQSWRQIL